MKDNIINELKCIFKQEILPKKRSISGDSVVTINYILKILKTVYSETKW